MPPSTDLPEIHTPISLTSLKHTLNTELKHAPKHWPPKIHTP